MIGPSLPWGRVVRSFHDRIIGFSNQPGTLGFEMILSITFFVFTGVCCDLSGSRFRIGPQYYTQQNDEARKLANHAKNSLFLPKTTVYGRKNILRVFAQLTIEPFSCV